MCGDVGDGSEEALGLHVGALLLTREDEHLQEQARFVFVKKKKLRPGPRQ